MRKKARTPMTIPAIAPPEILLVGVALEVEVAVLEEKAVVELEAVAAEAAEATLEADAASAFKIETITESDVCHRIIIGGALMSRDVDERVVDEKNVEYTIAVVLLSVDISWTCAGRTTVETGSRVTKPEPSVLGWLKAMVQ
jgi:hypothetical protein